MLWSWLTPTIFGTFPKFGGEVKKAVSYNTTFEHLACVGLNPGGFFGAGLLEAIVDITQHTGYGTDGCGAGSTEYVRYFVEGSHADGMTWDRTYRCRCMTCSATGPLSYAVSVDFNEARKPCATENIVNVRAILLSWQRELHAGNDPNFVPVWGNVINAKVQVAPRLLIDIPIGTLIADKAITVESPDLLSSIIRHPSSRPCP